MSAKNHSGENLGAKSRDQAQPRYEFLKHAHRDWRVWCVAVLMIILMLVYVLSDNLSLRPGRRDGQPMPASNLP